MAVRPKRHDKAGGVLGVLPEIFELQPELRNPRLVLDDDALVEEEPTSARNARGLPLEKEGAQPDEAQAVGDHQQKCDCPGRVKHQRPAASERHQRGDGKEDENTDRSLPEERRIHV